MIRTSAPAHNTVSNKASATSVEVQHGADQASGGRARDIHPALLALVQTMAKQAAAEWFVAAQAMQRTAVDVLTSTATSLTDNSKDTPNA
jgi:hypothetical protein